MRPRDAARLRRAGGFAVGVLLLAAAVALLVRSGSDLEQSLDHARRAAWWLVAAALILPLGNALFVTWSFHVLMNRFGVVPFGDMLRLIFSSWLLNYLPMRPGLVGRLAFHKTVHRVSLKNSAAVSVALALMTGLAAVHLLGIWAAFTLGWEAGATAAIATSVGVALLVRFAADHSPAGRVPRGALGAALLMRYADLIVWALRMAVAFAIIGKPIPLTVGVLLAAAIQIAYLVPVTGAGLGVAEWAVGFVAALSVSALDPADGIAASLITRAAEIVTAVPLGLLAGASLARQRRRARPGRELRDSIPSAG